MDTALQPGLSGAESPPVREEWGPVSGEEIRRESGRARGAVPGAGEIAVAALPAPGRDARGSGAAFLPLAARRGAKVKPFPRATGVNVLVWVMTIHNPRGDFSSLDLMVLYLNFAGWKTD